MRFHLCWTEEKYPFSKSVERAFYVLDSISRILIGSAIATLLGEGWKFYLGVFVLLIVANVPGFICDRIFTYGIRRQHKRIHELTEMLNKNAKIATLMIKYSPLGFYYSLDFKNYCSYYLRAEEFITYVGGINAGRFLDVEYVEEEEKKPNLYVVKSED